MIKFFVNRPLFTATIFAVLLLVGLFSLTKLPIDLLPDISLPTLTIITNYPGASAEDIETTVTKPIEDIVATVPNIDKITSTNSENISQVAITFKWGTNLDNATSDIRDKLDLIKTKLPDDAELPTIFKFDLSQIPALILGISADQSYPGLYDIADKNIGNALKRIQGVGTVTLIGGLQRQINIEIDRNRLEAYHLSIGQIISALQAANLTMPAGNIKMGSLNYSIRVPGEYTSTSQISNTIIGAFQGRQIYLKDIANVIDSFADTETMTRIDGKKGMMVMVQKQSGTNTVNVVKAVRGELEKIKKTLPSDISISIVMDGSESIVNSISNLQSTLVWAFLFVILTVFFFLRNIRGSVIVSLAIPFSLICAFIYLYLTKSSINMISLASIIMAIGMVVDNAIVVLENIYRHRDEKGEQPKEASIFGTGEVAAAVIASTITNLVVFVPIIMTKGFAAIFFQQLAITTTVVMSASLFISLSLTPMLASKFLGIKKVQKNGTGFIQMIHHKSDQWLDLIDENYSKAIAWALGRRRLIIFGSIIIFVLSMPLFRLVGSEFFPEQDTGMIQANIAMPVGTRWEETAAVMDKIEKIVLKEVPELRYVLVSAGSSQRSAMSSMSGAKTGPNYGRLMLRLISKTKRKRSTVEIQRLIAKEALTIPGIKSINFSSTGGANAMMGSGKAIQIEIYGYDLQKTDELAELIKAKISAIPGVVDPTISREKGNPELWVNVDREKAASLGLSMTDIASALRTNLYGTTATKYREGGDEYDIFVRLKEENRKTLNDLQNIFITSRTGLNVSLANIAKIEKRTGPLVIQRKNQERMVVVEADSYGRAVGNIVSDIRKEISKVPLPTDVSINIAGSTEQMKESFRDLGIALILGIILVYLVMVAQFESALEPFIIMFSVPFGLVGVVWALLFTGTPFGIMPFIGMIMVVGIAVNNAIVLIDYTNISRARGMKLKEAIVDAGKKRLRPILMTTGTTLLGIAPMTLSRGEGAEFWSPLGIAMLGGLLISTLITLILVPVAYTVIEERIKKREYGGRMMA